MATIRDVLDPIGITIEEARDFILANVGQPESIFDTAYNFGVTTQMLSEITGYSTNIISDYFVSFGLDTKLLDDVRILLNADAGTLAHFIDFNDHTGILSTASLRDQVKPLLEDSSDYDSFFGPVFLYQDADSIYTSDELGVSHLGNVPATSESIESLFYGTLLNINATLDDAELDQIANFPKDGNFAELQALLVETLSDVPPSIVPDTVQAGAVVNLATFLIEDYWSDVSVVGVLDHSFLGIAVAEF